ncbi:MBL fold metallo-hydrolase [Streptomyces pinistramenti]|uniref:MBL fold metallo-hydrolase n=1 Tax=Streptomyces pinistramenti TaxID=2884812 RepID=UPI001D075AC8|nr:MBL fold metallo-hydrolase [Streptomyces pinistramenti]MCB5906169.1 MBL fold metallo-hydrolase [Streptomyces pinistramenti]
MPVTIEIAGHATVLVRAHDFSLLCDPHLQECYRGGLLGYAPARRVVPQALPRPDAVWISHSHRDHFDIASLALLDRALPVLHPDDPRIHHALRRLGFTDTTVVHDWMTLIPRPGLELVWTPSTFAGPEHGLAIRTSDSFVWHMVDSLVTPAWVERLLGSGPPLDLLLTPCQPIEETRSVEGTPPGVDANWAEPLTGLLALARPTHVVPLPEGQYGLGDAAWLNGHKFPVPPGLVDQALCADDPERAVLRTAPGDRLTVSRGAVRREAGALAWAQATGEPCDRSYRPGAWIGPLVADRRPAAPSAQHPEGASPVEAGHRLDQLLALPPEVADGSSRIPVPGLAEIAASAAGRLRDTRYRFVAVGSNALPVAERTVRLDPEGTLTAEPPESVPDIEVAVTTSDLDDLLVGRLGYSAAQYGGRLREIRPGLATDPDPDPETGPTVLTSRHDALPAEGAAALSGIGLFALLLRARLGSALVELDCEIAACHEGRPVRPHSAARVRSLGPSAAWRPPQEAGFQSVWARLGRCLARGEDPATVSGTRTVAGRQRYVGVLGRAPWPAPACEPDDGVGLLLLAGLIEAQPHLGGGVRFPTASYRRLLENVESSPIRRWRVVAALPEGLSVPAWRAASLFPIPADRLSADLARRAWRGQILAPPRPSAPESGRPAERCWWLGVPPAPASAMGGRELWVAESPGCRVRGLVEPGLGADGAPLWTATGGRPDFRVWTGLPDHVPDPEAAVRDVLIRGDVRFSWLLPPGETNVRAGREVDPVAFAERVALLSLARLAHERAPAATDAAAPPESLLQPTDPRGL